MIFWFFGFPGVGKDYCATKLSELINSPHVNADDFIDSDYQNALKSGILTSKDRLKKLARICKYIKKLLENVQNAVVADSLPDQASRNFILDNFKNNVTLILVQASPKLHRQRISERTNHFFTAELLDSWIKQHWQDIKVPHLILHNNQTNELKLKKELIKIYKYFPDKFA